MLKVNAHGIQGDAARWIRSWLAGRHQRVCINQSYSNSGLEKVLISPRLVTLLHICGVIPTPQSPISPVTPRDRRRRRAERRRLRIERRRLRIERRYRRIE